MSKKEVIIYGASGYTGKLIAWHLAERGIPFIAAGRSKEHLEYEMGLVPELKTYNADYECVEAKLDRKTLADLFAGKKIVYNVVGPFMQLSEPVVQACLDAGCHYMDTTGEADWMKMLQENYGEDFARKELLLCPANAYMWTAGNIAAEIALERGGIDSVDVVYMADSNTSEASTASFLGMCCTDQYFLKNNQLELWPPATAYDVLVPGEHQTFQSLPWGGAGEPLWYRNDDRVINATTLIAFRRREMMAWVIGKMQEWHENLSSLPRPEQLKVINQWAEGLVNQEPAREKPDENRSTISCNGRGRTAGVQVVMRGSCPYIQAGIWAAESCRRILNGHLKDVGFTSPGKAIGHRELAAAAAEMGLLAWDVDYK